MRGADGVREVQPVRLRRALVAPDGQPLVEMRVSIFDTQTGADLTQKIGPVESITMEDLVIDEREMTTGADWDYRVYGPGDARYGNITVMKRIDKTTPLFQLWSGGTNPVDIVVTLHKRDGSEARRFSALECYPTRFVCSFVCLLAKRKEEGKKKEKR